MKKMILGLDIGGTKVEAALLKISESKGPNTSFRLPGRFIGQESEAYGEVLKRERIPTGRDRGYGPVMEDIANLCKGIANLDELDGIGVGLPGTVHPTQQKMLNGNSQIFIGKDFKQDLCKLLDKDLPVLLENDASCFALAEALSGAGATHAESINITPFDQIGIGIILGTGVGGGIIVGGQILSGANGGGGEIGHSELINDGLDCYCGAKGCVEQYLSGPGVQVAYKNLTSNDLSSFEVFEAALKNEPNAKKVVDDYITLLAKFITKLTNIFDPHFIVLGGGVSQRKELYKNIEKLVADASFLPQVSPKIYQHQLGDSAGVFGAAFLLLR